MTMLTFSPHRLLQDHPDVAAEEIVDSMLALKRWPESYPPLSRIRTHYGAVCHRIIKARLDANRILPLTYYEPVDEGFSEA